ncbi:hypothetical protein AALO_G00100310 [Alosa alosa]|uniref:Uncharacterized protein n=1 Tax=Alosa alosa TaxID=278164 RepID=A0AAV6GTU6_9TELE|nr:uncharacterized protein LOC125298514 [Alosa alosa]KAG5278563.1 hypothetical protein AALO_G00100310 [Alosa alosa]
MHQHAEICLPRKKKVYDYVHPNTFRIFDENVPDIIPPDKVSQDNKYATRSPEESQLLKTHNVPHPYNAKFIRTNVRFLNAPVVHMETDNTKDEQFKWWATESVDSERPKAPYCVDTTQRTDYQPTPPSQATRAKDERGRTFASAIIPTLDPLGQPKTLLEHISFTHQYDSRKLLNQPYQGGKHGTFAWTELNRDHRARDLPAGRVSNQPLQTPTLKILPTGTSPPSPPPPLHQPSLTRRVETTGWGRGGGVTEGPRPRRVELAQAETGEASGLERSQQ